MRKRKTEDPLSREARQALGRALGILRRRRGTSLSETAARTRVSMSTYHLWEQGQVEPSSEHLRDALATLGFDFHDLEDVLETVSVAAPESSEKEIPEEERLVREIVEDFALLLKLRERSEEARSET